MKQTFEQLNLNGYEVPYKNIRGQPLVAIPLLKNEGRHVLTIEDIMKKRIDVASNLQNDVSQTWLYVHFGTSTGTIQYNNEKLKLVSNLANKIDFNSARVGLTYHRSSTGLLLTDEQYNSISGIEFDIQDFKLYNGHYMTSEEAKTNPFFLAIANNNKNLLESYINTAASLVTNEYGIDFKISLFIHEKGCMPEYVVDWKDYLAVQNHLSSNYIDYKRGDENIILANFLTIESVNSHSEISNIGQYHIGALLH